MVVLKRVYKQIGQEMLINQLLHISKLKNNNNGPQKLLE